MNGDFGWVWVFCAGVGLITDGFFIADGSDVVGEGECALPLAGGLVAAEGFEDGSGVLIGDWVGGDAGLVGLELVGGDAL